MNVIKTVQRDKSVSASLHLESTRELSHGRSMEFQIISLLTHRKSGPHVTFYTEIHLLNQTAEYNIAAQRSCTR